MSQEAFTSARPSSDKVTNQFHLCLSFVFTEFNFGTSTSGDTIVCGVVLSPYPLFTMFVTSPSSSGSLSPTHVLAVTTETIFIFGFCQSLWWSG